MLLLLLSLSDSLAATHTVGPNGTFATLQEAADTAQDGDTLQLQAGLFFDCLQTDARNLTLVGAGQQNTFLYGQCESGTLLFNGGSVTVEGVSFDNRVGPSVRSVGANTTLRSVEVNGGESDLGAVSIEGGHTVVEDSDISFNQGESGPGIHAEGGQADLGSSIIIRGTTFVENASTASGGAVWIRGISQVELVDSTFERNSSQGNGGAVSVRFADSLLVDGTQFVSNGSDEDGGALYARDAGDVTIDGVVFTDGVSAQQGGGLYVLGAGVMTLANSTFLENQADSSGAAYVSVAESVSITASEFGENTSVADVAGVEVVDVGTLLLNDATFYRNNAVGNVAALRAEQIDDTTFIDSSFLWNRTGASNASFYLQSDSVVIEDSEVRDGYADVRAGFEVTATEMAAERFTVFDNDSPNGPGGGRLEVEVVRIGNSIVSNQSVSFGSAGLEIQGSQVDIYDTIMHGNRSGIFGATLSVPGHALTTIERVTMGNRPTLDTVYPILGTGVLVEPVEDGLAPQPLVIRDSSFAGISANAIDSSGDVYLQDSVIDNAQDSRFSASTAAGVTAARAYVNGSQFLNNDASSEQSTTGIAADEVYIDNSLFLNNTGRTITTNTGRITSSTMCGSRSAVRSTGPLFMENVEVTSNGDAAIELLGPDNELNHLTVKQFRVFRESSHTHGVSMVETASIRNTAFIDLSRGISFADPVLYAGSGQFNLYWDTTTNVVLTSPFEPFPLGRGSLEADPNFAFDMRYPTDCAALDLRPLPGSALIDAGDPLTQDVDGTRADIGAYGGARVPIADVDGDGFYAPADCDESNPNIHPLAEELCDDIDNDCDGIIDNSRTRGTVWYLDVDRDGFGGESEPPIVACVQPDPGYVDNADDCNDTETGASSMFPGNPEVCDDIDNDCNGQTDDRPIDGVTAYVDGDNDSYGTGSATTACAVGWNTGFASRGDDCDDTTTAVRPGNTERCDGLDTNCDSFVDNIASGGTVYYADDDGDLFGDPSRSRRACERPDGFALNPNDCDDERAFVNPNATEVCNGIDDDCDRRIDTDADDYGVWYPDDDQDGFGLTSAMQQTCQPDETWIVTSGDCDDTTRAISPTSPETCNGVDDNCNGQVDVDAETYGVWYPDNDDDGYGLTSAMQQTCRPDDTWTDTAGDCDDDASIVNPLGTETCNGIDDDCNGQADTDLPEFGTWYTDADDDGWGDPNSAVDTCDPHPAAVMPGGDCDDTRNDVGPFATEVCNGIDDDCDGTIDIDVDGAPVWFADDDGDGYGTPTQSMQACSAPQGFVGNADDCNDSEPTANPLGTETCNGIDDDCDGTVDNDAPGLITVFYDQDGDGYGTPNQSMQACDVPQDYAELDGDCNDADGDVFPGAVERCNEQDDDCNDVVDDDAVDTQTFYADDDQDNFGDPDDFVTQCDEPQDGWWSTNGDDCDPTNPFIYPGADELPDDIDQNCDGEEDNPSDPDTDEEPDTDDNNTPNVDDDTDDPSGCQSAPAPTALFPLALLAIAFRRRRVNRS